MFTGRIKLLIGVFVVLVLGYVAYGAMVLGWFNHDPIPLTSRTENVPTPPRRRNFLGLNTTPAPSPVQAVFFGMDRKYYITSILVEPVVPAESVQAESESGVYTAPRTGPLWHVVAGGEDGPPRLQNFRYGEQLRGMQPAEGSPRRPAPLQPGVDYRMVVQAGGRRGELTFQTKPSTH